MQEQRLAEARKIGYLDENNEPTGVYKQSLASANED